MPKFDLKEHDRRIREILNPPQPAGNMALQRLKEIARKQRPRKRV